MEAGRDAHDVSGQDDVEDLALAVAQQLVTDGVAVLYERELAILLASTMRSRLRGIDTSPSMMAFRLLKSS